jgi:hypothetical protein
VDGAMVAHVELRALAVELWARRCSAGVSASRRGSSGRVASIGGMKGMATFLS